MYEAFAGDFIIGAGVSYGEYSMENFKYNNFGFQHSLPFDTRIIDDFPGYFTFSGEIGYLNQKDFYYSIKYTYESTGSRIGASDFSGYYKLDQTLNSNSLSLCMYYKAILEIDLFLFLGAEYGLKYTNYQVLETFRLNGLEEENTNDSQDFLNSYLFPGIKIAYQYKSLIFALCLNYHIGISGDTYKLAIAEEWNGLRFGISLLYSLFN